MSALGTARDLASTAHAGQHDLAGQRYIDHPMRVAQEVRSSGGEEDVEVAAWLHDVLEDTLFTADDLRTRGVSERAIELVELLTRTGKTDLDYYAAIRADEDARHIKACDIHDNLNPRRLADLPKAEATRLRAKYGGALTALFG